ncbi:MAG: YbaN family protein [Woeseiaceae bacterium]|nr:YbaN family protein [Woeseiaceae bacterium]
MVSHAKRIVLILIGVVSLALGALGVFLPLLPTTPFVLLAAFAFANSSERLHQWLLDHNVFGPLIADWRSHGAIGRRTKIVSLVSMAAIVGISLLLAVPTHVIVVQAVVLTASAIFIATRPLPPE